LPHTLTRHNSHASERPIPPPLASSTNLNYSRCLTAHLRTVPSSQPNHVLDQTVPLRTLPAFDPPPPSLGLGPQRMCWRRRRSGPSHPLRGIIRGAPSSRLMAQETADRIRPAPMRAISARIVVSPPPPESRCFRSASFSDYCLDQTPVPDPLAQL